MWFSSLLLDKDFTEGIKFLERSFQAVVRINPVLFSKSHLVSTNMRGRVTGVLRDKSLHQGQKKVGFSQIKNDIGQKT